jgi:hypothetical protein
MKYRIGNIEMEKFTLRMFYLAWKASQVVGMGVLQDCGNQSEEEVWKRIHNRADYPGSAIFAPKNGIVADYVFGRMMKLYVKIDTKENTVECNSGDNWRIDYQSFCGKYPTFKHLVDATIQSFGGETINIQQLEDTQ